VKTRVVQLITFEIESGDVPLSRRWAEESDRVCEEAAKKLRFDLGDGVHAGTGVYLESVRAGLVSVTVAKVSAEDLTHIMADRRRVNAENGRLKTRVAALESWVHAQVEAVAVGAELARQGEPQG